MQFKVAYDLKLRKNESFLEIYKGRWTFIGTAYEFKSLFFKSSGVVESTDLLTLKRRCAEPSCFSGFADLTDGSIPVCGMILSERNVVKSMFLLFFFL